MSESSILFTYGTYEAHLGEDIRKYLDDRSRDTFDRIIVINLLNHLSVSDLTLFSLHFHT